MPPFNPQIQPTPDFKIDWSREISQPEADKSTGTLLSGIGTTIEQGAKAGDQIVKELIDQEVYKKASETRSAWTTQLLSQRHVKKNMISGDGTSPDVADPMDANAQAVPGDLAQLEGQVSSIQSAREAGKVSTSYYWMMLNNLAADTRAKYGPGYYEYIDHKFSSITGHNPANAYVAALQQDLNRTATAKADPEFTKALTSARKAVDEGVPGATDAYSELVTSKNVKAFNNFISPANAKFYENKVLKNEAERTDMEAKAGDILATNYINKTAAERIDNQFRAAQTKAGMTPAAINQIALDVLSGKTKVSEQQAILLRQQMEANRESLFQELLADYNKIPDPNDPDSKSISMKAGKEKTLKLLNENFNTYDRIATYLSAKRPDMATFAQDMLTAKTQDAHLQLLSDKTMGDYFTIMEALEKHPEYARKVWDRMLLLPGEKDPPGGVSNGRAATAFIKDFKLSANTAALPEYPATAEQPGAKRAIEKLQAAAKTGKVAVTPKSYSDIIDTVTAIGANDTPLAIREGLALTMYRPENLGTISKFARGDQMDVFTKAGSTAISQKMFELGKTQPKAWEMYKNYQETAFASELFGQAIRDIHQYQQIQGLEITYNDKHEFGVRKTSQGGPERPLNTIAQRDFDVQYQSIGRQLTELNRGIAVIAGMAKASGADPVSTDAYVVGLMKGIGLDTDKVQQMKAASGMMYKAIERFRIGPPAPNNARTEGNNDNRDAGSFQFAEESKPRFDTFSDWLNNPTRSSADIQAQMQAFEERKAQLMKEEALKSGTKNRSMFLTEPPQGR